MTSVFNFTFVPWFRSVAPYIHKFRNQTFVVGIAGEAIAAGKLQHLVASAVVAAAVARAEPNATERVSTPCWTTGGALFVGLQDLNATVRAAGRSRR